MKFSVVIPCYREANRIMPHLHEIDQLLQKKFKQSYEIIAVDDGSTDQTLEILKLAKTDISRLKVIHYSPNKGKGYAVKVGMLNACGQVTAYIDADGEIPPRHLIEYYDYLKKTHSDIVIGSKLHENSEVEFNRFRQLASQTFRDFTQKSFNLGVKDTQVGLKMFTSEAKNSIFPMMRTYGFAFDLEVLAWAQMLGFQVKEQPVQIVHQNQNSSVSLKIFFKVFYETLRIRKRLNEDLIITSPDLEAGNFKVLFARTPIFYA